MLGFWLFQIQTQAQTVTHSVRNPEALTEPRWPERLGGSRAAEQQFASAEDARPRHGACAGAGTWWMLRGQHVLRVSLHVLCLLSTLLHTLLRSPSVHVATKDKGRHDEIQNDSNIKEDKFK